MSDIMNILPYSADLSKPLDKTDLHTLFVMGDNQAHRFEIEILSGSKAVDLSGSTVTGYFTNFKEDTTVEVAGNVEGGKAVVVLSKPCYTLHGQFVLAIQIKSGEVEDTVFLGEGFMRRTKSETIIYDDYIVYDVSTLLTQISAMRTATDNANKAAADANAAAEHAPYVDEATGYWMYWDVGAGKYVSTGTPATGPQGAPGNDGEDGETPYIGSNGNWWIGQTDTGVKAQGPAGANGTGSGTVTGVKIGENTYAPDSSGLVDMSGMTAPNADQLNGKDADEYALKTDLPTKASDVGALASDGTAADSLKLGGKEPKYYTQPRNLLDNSWWKVKKEIVNQREQTSYTGDGYTIDRWSIWGVNDDASLTVNDSGITFNPGSGGGTLSQKIPLGILDSAKTYTLAVHKSSGETEVKTDGVTFNHNGEADLVTISGVAETILWAALYEGEYTADNLPPYVPKGYAVELAECQRYYCHISSQNGRPVGTGMTYGASNCRVLIPTPVTMIATPSIIATPSNCRVTTATGSQHTISSIEAPVLHGNGVSVSAVADGAQSNYVCALFMAASEIFALSADL